MTKKARKTQKTQKVETFESGMLPNEPQALLVIKTFGQDNVVRATMQVRWPKADVPGLVRSLKMTAQKNHERVEIEVLK